MSTETAREQFLVLRPQGSDEWEAVYTSQVVTSLTDQPNPKYQNLADLYTNSFEYADPTQYRQGTGIIDRTITKLNSDQATDTITALASMEKELLDAGLNPELDLYRPDSSK